MPQKKPNHIGSEALTDSAGTTDSEANLKAMNLAAIKYMANGAQGLVSSDITSVENLAFSCPYIDSDGVYTAHFLYQQLSDMLYYLMI